MQLALGRADVGDDRVRAARVERLGNERGQRTHRRRAEDDLGALERLGDRPADAVERPDLERRVRAFAGSAS